MPAQSHVSLRLKLMFLLAASFVLLAPMSVAPNFSLAEAAKYFRLGATALIVIIGLMGRLYLGLAGRTLAVFTILYVVSAVWSGSALWGLFNKGMFGLSCLSGLFLAASLRTS